MNAVTYARYSTGRQRKASLDEQSRVPQMYRQLAFELARALKADITTAREILRPLVEGAAQTEENGQKWIKNETGRAAGAGRQL